jgi:hypothetical protein
MSTEPSSGPRHPSGGRRRLPVTTWIGIGGAVLLGGLGALSGGFWMMLVWVALVVLLTALYGLAFRRTTWLRLPRKRIAAGIGAVVALVVLIGSSAAYGAAHPTPPAHVAAGVASSAHTNAAAAPASAAASAKAHAAAPKKTHTPTPTPTPTPVVTTKLVTETSPVPFQSSTVTSATMAQGTSSVTTAGVNGVETKTYVVTYSEGTETARSLQSDVVTTPPVTQVTTVGSYVAPPPPPPAPAAPSCTNGTYVNSAGNTVCRPEVSSSAPSGATAKCVDGTYSFSQSRRGTCSSHGGVATWL